MNPQQYLPFIGGIVSVGGIIFQTGKHAEKIDFLWGVVHAQEKKEEYNNATLYEIKSDVKTLSHDITAIKGDIHEIKNWKNNIH